MLYLLMYIGDVVFKLTWYMYEHMIVIHCLLICDY